MALNSAQTKAIAYIDEIYSLSKSNRFTLMLSKINNLYIFLYTNKSILYSNINRYFYKIGLVPILTNYCYYVSHETVKDILRLLHIFIKTNRNIEEVIRKSGKFLKYLSAILCTETTWDNIGTFRYHIHVGAYLLLDPVGCHDLDVATIRTIIRGKLDENIHCENNLFYTICYACTMPITSSTGRCNLSLTSRPTDDPFSLSCVEHFSLLIKTYLGEFKTFYKDLDNTPNEYSLFVLEAEYTFDQICHSISYYSRLNEQIYANIFKSAIYQLITEIIKIQNLPKHFLSRSLDILSITEMYSKLEERIQNDNNQTFSSLTSDSTECAFNSRNLESGKLLTNQYWSYESKSLNDADNFSMNGKHTLLSIESEGNLESKRDSFKEISNVKIFLNVDEWLIENGLRYLRTPFSRLTERGLYQMKTLLKTTDNRIRLMELLTTKLDIEIIGALEFLECLDNLKFN